MLRAYLVLGPESSGTRMMTEILIAAGCVGDPGHDQHFDQEFPTEETIVWRRSVPHGGEWPPLDLMIHRLKQSGYAVFAVVTMRDWTAMARSQVEHWNHSFDSAINNIRTAYPYIFSSMLKFQVPYIMTSYESLKEYGPQKDLFSAIGLEAPAFEVRDENRKRLEVMS
ncbi:hypothetical protein LCGC14_0289110 [marine sediment metagenome]|uniref:NadR/Ttd14 AAA domain-containing protein n=1 Tax=marine sediment metagenome TaxID=412755 RepID=A0A0F9TYR6_9ZZZZ